MATPLTSPWQLRIHNATKEHNEWAVLFQTNACEDYFEGRQWRQSQYRPGYRPYVLNLVQTTIRTKMAGFIFQRPSYKLSPRPGFSDWNLGQAIQSATLKEDTLNTLVQNPNMDFVQTLKDVALDSYLRFGMVEVGYAADWQNPANLAPVVDPDDTNDEKPKILHKEEIPVNEYVYCKRINPTHFRCATGPAKTLKKKNWCGYWEDYLLSDLKSFKELKWPEGGFTADSTSSDYDTSGSVDSSSILTDTEKGILSEGRTVRCWHIWDAMSKKRRLLIDGSFHELWSGDYERLPLIDIRWIFRTKGFYPIPPVSSWLCPQDEINESREQMRSYRRRFTRKFQTVKDQVDEEEKTKFEEGGDGTIIEVKQQNAITAIENPALPNVVQEAAIVGKDDFQIVSGSSSQIRGNADRETATAATIKDQRLQIIESAEELDFSTFACLIGREIIVTAIEKMSQPLWVKYNLDPGDQPTVLMDAQVIQYSYKMIRASDLADGYDFSTDIDIMNATPAAMEAASQAFFKFVAAIQSSPMLAMSPDLIREAAYRCGYRNEKVITDMQQVAILSMVAKGSVANGGQPLGLNGQQPQQSTQQAQMATPDASQVTEQISQQLQVAQ